MQEVVKEDSGHRAIALLLQPSLKDANPDVAASEPEPTGEQAAKLEAADRAMAAVETRTGADFIAAVEDLFRIWSRSRT